MSSDISILWFDQDLRVQDNPALLAASKMGKVLPVFIINPDSELPLGEASRWWLHQSLQSLDDSLSSTLNYYSGDECEVLLDICQRLGIKDVCWNKRFEPWKANQECEIKQRLEAQGIRCQTFNATLLHEPSSILKKDGTPYKVFTPFYRYATRLKAREAVVSDIATQQLEKDSQALSLSELDLLPHIVWYTKLDSLWQPGEQGAHTALANFIAHNLNRYEQHRDFPESNASSNLASHIHFGEISIAQILDALPELTQGSSAYIRQLYWREFSYYLLHFFPRMRMQNLKPQFNDFAWSDDP